MHTLHASNVRYACIHDSRSASRLVGATPYTVIKFTFFENNDDEDEEGKGNFHVALNSSVLWWEMLLNSI